MSRGIDDAREGAKSLSGKDRSPLVRLQGGEAGPARVRTASPEGPVHLLGDGFGGWVALELALALREAGCPVASLTVLNGAAPNDSGAEVHELDARKAFLDSIELAAGRSLGPRSSACPTKPRG